MTSILWEKQLNVNVPYINSWGKIIFPTIQKTIPKIDPKNVCSVQVWVSHSSLLSLNKQKPTFLYLSIHHILPTCFPRLHNSKCAHLETFLWLFLLFMQGTWTYFFFSVLNPLVQQKVGSNNQFVWYAALHNTDTGLKSNPWRGLSVMMVVNLCKLSTNSPCTDGETALFIYISFQERTIFKASQLCPPTPSWQTRLQSRRTSAQPHSALSPTHLLHKYLMPLHLGLDPVQVVAL